MRPDQFLQFAFMVRRKLNRWGLRCRHGSPSLSRQGGDSHSESTPDSPATAGGEPISAVRYVSTTLIQPGSEFKLGFSGSPRVADGSCCGSEEIRGDSPVDLWTTQAR